MALLPQEFIDRVKSNTDVLDLVGQAVTLRKAGHEFIGLCPFHQEKSPSFSVSPAKQFYHCFGCGAHGGVVDFLTEYGGYSFMEAVELLAQRAGIAMPQRAEPTPEEREAHSHLDALRSLQARAQRIFAAALRDRDDAIQYLKGRGLTGETAKRFGLGFSVDGIAHIFSDTPSEALLNAGLLAERAGGQLVDKFRGRVMFPIHDEMGQVVGFGGRVLDDREPKYLNSPDSPIFHKGQELYGLHLAKADIRRARVALVMEGYMDVIALHQFGETRAVAALGTSVTTEQVKRLLQLADNVVFCMDGDAAGRKAAARAVRIVLEVLREGKTAHFVTLPSEHDPDSFIRERGVEAWRQYVDKEALPLSAKVVEILASEKTNLTPEARAQMAVQAQELLALIVAAPQYREALRTHLEKVIELPLPVSTNAARGKPSERAAIRSEAAALGIRAPFYAAYARLCALQAAELGSVPEDAVDDFAALIAAWFSVVQADPAPRREQADRINDPVLRGYIVDALEGLAARDPRALQPSMEAEAAALLSTIRRDINKVASAKRVASLFESA